MIAVANAPCSWGVLEFESKSRQSGLRTGARRDRRKRIRRHGARRLGLHANRARRCCENGSTAGVSPWLARLSRHVWPIPVRMKRACTPRSRRRGCSPRSATARRPVIVLSDEPTADPAAHRSGRPRSAGSEPDRAPVGRCGERCRADCRRRSRRDRPAHGVPSSLRRVRGDTGRDRRAHAKDGSVTRRSVSRFRPCDVLAEARRSSCCRATARGRGTSTSKTASRISPSAPGGSSWTTRRRFVAGSSASWGAAASIFQALLRDLQDTGYDGWIVVEQDVLPAMGSPLASATRNRRYLRGIGL